MTKSGKPDSAAAGGIGPRLARLRAEKKLSIEELSEKTGLEVAELESIEKGNVFPPVGDILKISRSLTVDPSRLLGGDEKDHRKKRAEDFKKRVAAYNYEVLTPDAENMHLRAFRITIPAGQEHPKISYQHEGEEFVYALEGQVEITVGKKKKLLARGESLHFDSGIAHSLKNPGSIECSLIVTVYTP